MSNDQITTPVVPGALRVQAARWAELKRWERRELGQALRRLGLSYREIRSIIPVPAGTLSGWCRDIELDEHHVARLRILRPDAVLRQELGLRRRRAAVSRHDAVRAAGRAEARAFIEDARWVAGVVAYWAEGAKRTTSLKFSNSDPAMVDLFIRWAEDYLQVTRDRFTVTMHLHDGQAEEERLRFWSHATGIPAGQFGKTFIKPEGTGHRKNILYNGTASIRIRRSGEMFDRVMGWIEVVAEAFAREGSEAVV